MALCGGEVPGKTSVLENKPAGRYLREFYNTVVCGWQRTFVREPLMI